ncbi:DUF6616 family protein [Sphingomonas sp. NCPPB 2930]|uniref:DUF6616 family protein n=1 Tax=Sphingomonas sp. NCPPB 2930 TaxID=3162788 RepID=UPI0036DD8E78
MTHHLTELYSPKPAWLALDQLDRQRFFEKIGAGMAALSVISVEAIAFSEAEAAVVHAPSHRFFALWRAPDASAIEALVHSIAASGWHDYFETVNVTGSGVGINDHLAQLAAL